ncbi:hypothetical protein AB1L30_01115 [Bremerella sp. JC817]|uniref:hypothetical protein n=1 Tax=Bremerella sp. JC817 TaxID=3231756 RepID=UPI003458CB18
MVKRILNCLVFPLIVATILALPWNGRLAAQPPSKNRAYAQQFQLSEAFLASFEAGDLKRQQVVLQRMKQLVAETPEGPYVYSPKEIDAALRDLDKALSTSPENLELATRFQFHANQADEQNNLGNPAGALRHYALATQAAHAVYGRQSFYSILLNISYARNEATPEADMASAIARLKASLIDIEAMGLTDSHQHCHAVSCLCRIYAMQEDLKEATKYGHQAIEIHQRRKTNFGSQYAEIVSIQALLLNRMEEYKESLKTTRAALSTELPSVGVEARFTMRIFREYAAAKVKLNDPENVSVAYDQAYALANAIPGCPDDTKLTLLTEHLEFLKSHAEEARARNIESQIAKLRGFTATRSRYSDPQ